MTRSRLSLMLRAHALARRGRSPAARSWRVGHKSLARALDRHAVDIWLPGIWKSRAAKAADRCEIGPSHDVDGVGIVRLDVLLKAGVGPKGLNQLELCKFRCPVTAIRDGSARELAHVPEHHSHDQNRDGDGYGVASGEAVPDETSDHEPDKDDPGVHVRGPGPVVGTVGSAIYDP